ncbi:unnamed protein product [Closterium sp. NIES-65]|nr:unnamed protein product [Closterium sp. NIES-65]
MTSAVTNGEPRQADVDEFRESLSRASRVAVLTGSGVSAASGVPTFRGAGGLWRTYDATVGAMPRWVPCHAHLLILIAALLIPVASTRVHQANGGSQWVRLLHCTLSSSHLTLFHPLAFPPPFSCVNPPPPPPHSLQPAAGYARVVRAAGGRVAEFNAEATALSPLATWKFPGDSAMLLPLVLG